MASIRKRGPAQFEATVRRKGFPKTSKTFENRSAAEKWATVIESEMHRGLYVNRSESERTTLSEALDRYAHEKKWPRLFEQLSPRFKWTPASCQRCRVIHGGERRLRRTQSRGA